MLAAETTVAGLSHGCAANERPFFSASRGYGVQVDARHDLWPPTTDEAPPLATLPHRCFPNPCKPRTEIDFGLVRSGQVSVSIFDLAGRLVARPWQGEMPAGTGRVAWRGATDGGRAVPSGQYRPDATTGARSASRRSDGVTTGACAPISRA